ncbi:MAG: hypothetical protein ACWGNV_10195 [Bacteroidales bacterium]
MKTKQTKGPLQKIDERTKGLALRVIAVMYFLTILSMQGIVLYRQLALGQEIERFEDIAVIMVVNTLFLITGFLYYGVIPIRKLRLRSVLLIYLAIVILGSIFTYVKYNVVMDQGLSIQQIFDKVIIVIAVTGLMLLFFILFYFLGKRKMDKALEE